jgi:hypothetical protein
MNLITSMFIFSFFVTLTFYKYGKFLLIFFSLTTLVVIYLKKLISKPYIAGFSIYMFITLIFLYSFNIALLKGNELIYILYDFNYTQYILYGIILHYYLYQKYKNDMLNAISLFLSKIGLLGILVWLFSIYPPFNLFISKIIDISNFSFSLAGYQLPNLNLNKLISNISLYYVFFLPIAYRNYKLNEEKTVFFIILIVVLLSASLTQYVLLLMYIALYSLFIFFKHIKNFYIFKKQTLYSLVLVSLLLILFVQSPIFDAFVKTKINAFSNTSEVNTVSTRMIQGKILLEEFQDDYLLGKGLGYESKKYNAIRETFDELKDRNRAMYENQYLDIFLKFGIFGATSLLIIYIIFPLFLLLSIRLLFPEWKVVFVGYIGFFIFIGSNGNLFYAPQTMLLWGLLLTNSLYLYYERREE